VEFTGEQRRRIDEAAAAERVTLAEIVRRAVDAYLCAGADPPVRRGGRWPGS
jgi:hypothetical protein